MKDLKFIVRPELAYTLIIFGMINFLAINGGLLKLNILKISNWPIYYEYGLEESWLVAIMFSVMIFDFIIVMVGVYFLKHLEPEHKKPKNVEDFTKEDTRNNQ